MPASKTNTLNDIYPMTICGPDNVPPVKDMKVFPKTNYHNKQGNKEIFFPPLQTCPAHPRLRTILPPHPLHLTSTTDRYGTNTVMYQLRTVPTQSSRPKNTCSTPFP